MNENSKPTLQQWLNQAEARLKDKSTTPRLDARVIAEKTAGYYLFIDTPLPGVKLKQLERCLKLRERGWPIAYIIGEKEFYSRSFKVVTGQVLIPRPETENLIELIERLKPRAGDKLLDVGTGSGIIAITAKLEWPYLEVHASDISQQAIDAAEFNAKRLKSEVKFFKSDLLGAKAGPPYRFIVANLPYVNRSWQRSPETSYEPEIALFASDGGLALIKKLITQTHSALRSDGYLLLEADPRQHKAITEFAGQHGFKPVASSHFALAFTKA